MRTERSADSIARSGPGGLGFLPRRARLLARLAKLVLLAEAATAAFWPLLPLGLGFLAFAWLGLPGLLPVALHAAALGVFLLALLAVLWRGRGLRWPRREDAWRRLERDSGLRHRPLSHLDDAQASNLVDPGARALWSAHRRDLLARLRSLALRPPQAGLARRDPLALRHLAVLAAALGFFLAADPLGRDLASALRPAFGGAAAPGQASRIEIWISPPAYTGLPPLSLSGADVDAAAAPLAVPVGSKLLAQVEGLSAARLRANGEELAFASLDRDVARIEAELRSGEEIAVLDGFSTLARWPLRLVPDRAPGIAFDGQPAASERGALSLRYRAEDDYGVDKITLSLRRDGEALSLDLPFLRAEGGGARGQAWQDLTAHPWAGLPVELTLQARDALGQTGASAPLTMTLPERSFFHPVARLLVELRKRLVRSGGELAARREIAQALDRVREARAAYGGAPALYLGMDMAARRLRAPDAAAAAAREGVQRLLWDMALDLEDGGVSLAMRELRRLQRALAEALARGAPPEELRRLMDELQAAMNRYLQGLQQQLEQALRDGLPMRRLSPEGLNYSRQDLNRMLEEARRMAEGGARDSAQDLLDRLQRTLENLQAGVPTMMGEAGARQQRMLSDLAKLMQRQQQLQQQSFDAARRGSGGQGQGGQEGRDGQGGGDAGAAAQEGLRGDLGDLMRRFGDALGDIPAGMGDAEQAMREATGALQGRDFEGAASAQGRALERLQQSLSAMGEMLRRQAGQQPGPGERDAMDPFGRPAETDADSPGGNTVDTDNVRLPGEPAIERARRIFEELRQRRADPKRPKPERDYLDRLLKQF